MLLSVAPHRSMAARPVLTWPAACRAVCGLCAVSDLLRKLPRHGVGCVVARDTWHPIGGKYWEVTEVVPQRVRPGAQVPAASFRRRPGRRKLQQRRAAAAAADTHCWSWVDA